LSAQRISDSDFSRSGTMKQTLLAFAFVVLAATSSRATIVTVDPDNPVVTIQNTSTNDAEDVQFILIAGTTTQKIDELGSTGGTAFPNLDITSTNTNLIFDATGMSGTGPGVPKETGTYKVDFTGWTKGTQFDVKWSAPFVVPNFDVTVLAGQPQFPVQGFVFAVPFVGTPEPPSLLIFSIGAVLALGYVRLAPKRWSRA
jgi:hypothetical protein